MALDKGFVKPQHPLPKEIQEMKRDETICQFCGVSYLIHNEIKKLEDEMLKLRNKLQQYEGFDKREAELTKSLKEEEEQNKELLAKLSHGEQRNNSLSDDVAKLNLRLKTLETEYVQCKDKLQERETIVSYLVEKGKQTRRSLGNILKEVQCIKEENKLLLCDYNGLRVQNENQILKALETLERMKDENEIKRSMLIEENDKLQREFEEMQIKFNELKSELAQSEETVEVGKNLQSALSLKTKELESINLERSKLISEKEAVSNALDKIKVLLGQRNQKLNETESTLKDCEKLLKKTIEEKSKVDLEHKKDKENIYKQLKDCENEIEGLKNTRNAEKEEISTTSIQLKVLKECVDKSNKEVAVLKKERQDMIEAHQNRIKQLRESFRLKVLEADSWPKKLEEKLTMQRQELNEEKAKLWEEMTSSFQKEMKELNHIHEKEKLEIESKENSKAEKIKNQLETLQKRSREEIINLQAILSKEQEKHRKINQSQESLIQNLELKIMDLEKRLANLQQTASNEDSSYKQKYADTKRALEYIRLDFDQLEKELVTKKQEIDVLHETVRRECEERFELTDALGEARLQLLSLQKRTTVKSSLTNKMVPSPPATSSSRSSNDKVGRVKSIDSLENKTNSTQCSASKDKGITFSTTRSISEEKDSRKRIADALAKQRASSRASFDKFS